MKVTEIGIKESRTHCSDSDCCQRDSAEHEGYDRVLTEKRITENNITDADSGEDGLLERILEPRNLNQAYKQVKTNKGSHGVDGMEVEHLLQYLKDKGDELRKSILEGKYRPKPVRRVEIPKDNGKKRQLGIPTVVDRVIQQAIQQVLPPIYEPKFSETSYGFRSKRSTHDALRKCKEYANEGYTYSPATIGIISNFFNIFCRPAENTSHLCGGQFQVGIAARICSCSQKGHWVILLTLKNMNPHISQV